MEYNDEQLLDIAGFENMAKAYSAALKNRGFMIVQIDNDNYLETLTSVLEELYIIKNNLFMLGGFLNTSKFYSLNERQTKKLLVLFDKQLEQIKFTAPRDKTKCFLSFLSHECKLISLLLRLSQETNYEVQIKEIIEARLSLLSQILAI